MYEQWKQKFCREKSFELWNGEKFKLCIASRGIPYSTYLYLIFSDLKGRTQALVTSETTFL